MVSIYSLLAGQREFIHVDPDVTFDVCIYQGGYGSGKTFIGDLLGILLCQKYPGILGLSTAKTYPMLRDTTIKTYMEHLERLEFSNKDYSFAKSEKCLTFHCFGGSQIIFRNMEDPEKVKSINAGFIQCEEVSMFTEGDFLMLMSRLRQRGIQRYRFFGHTNPQSSKGWIHKNFVENGGKKLVKSNDNTERVIHYRRVVAASTDNVHLSPEYLANMENQFDDEYYRINVLGQDGDYTAGLVCKTWSNANIDETRYRPDLRIYLSCDFNIDPNCWVLAHRFNGEYHFFDEVCLPNSSTIECAEEVYRRYKDHKQGVTVTGDASGQNRNAMGASALETNYTQIRNRLSQLGVTDVRLDLRSANPHIIDRVAAWNAMVRNSAGVVRVKVHPRCKWLIYNCENLKYIDGSDVIWEPSQRLIQQDANLKYTKHVWDAASYLVERYDPIKLEVPATKKPKMIAQPFTPTRRF
jgi:PBSX family phage terminase large subunit